MKDYYINSETLMILPESNEATRIYELNGDFLINKNTMDLIDESCMFFGSNYQGRYLGSKSLLKMNYKLPIIVDEHREIIFFPSSSPRQNDCHWISLNNIENYFKNDKTITINFKNGMKYNLNMSYGSFENQVFRATMLAMILKKKKTL